MDHNNNSKLNLVDLSSLGLKAKGPSPTTTTSTSNNNHTNNTSVNNNTLTSNYNQGQSCSLTIKAYHQNVIRRVSILYDGLSFPLSELNLLFGRLFPQEANLLEKKDTGSPSYYYRDDEGDWILICDEQDLANALNELIIHRNDSSSKVLHVRLGEPPLLPSPGKDVESLEYQKKLIQDQFEQLKQSITTTSAASNNNSDQHSNVAALTEKLDSLSVKIDDQREQLKLLLLTLNNSNSINNANTSATNSNANTNANTSSHQIDNVNRTSSGAELAGRVGNISPTSSHNTNIQYGQPGNMEIYPSHQSAASAATASGPIFNHQRMSNAGFYPNNNIGSGSVGVQSPSPMSSSQNPNHQIPQIPQIQQQQQQQVSNYPGHHIAHSGVGQPGIPPYQQVQMQPPYGQAVQMPNPNPPAPMKPPKPHNFV